MHSMATCYVRSIRLSSMLSPALGHSICSIHVRTCTSRKSWQNMVQNVKTSRSLLASHTGIPDSYVRFLCQETPLRGPGEAAVEEQNSETEVSKLMQSPTAVCINSSYPETDILSQPIGAKLTEKQNFDYLDPLAEDVSVEEGRDVPEMKKEMLQQKFRETLQKCTSPSDVLDLTMMYSLTGKQNSSCLSTMWEVTKKMSEEQKWLERRLMFEHPAFPQLCYQVMQAARSLTCEDLVYSLHAVVKLRVSQRTRLIQTLVRVCQERLNEFDERAISVLASCLEVMDGSKNVDALRSGLQLLVELRIPEIKSVLPLQTMMRCIGKDAPHTLKKKLEHKALSIFDQFSLPNCQHMFVTLDKMDLLSLPILDACSNKVIQNISGIPFWRLVHILQSCRNLQYRNMLLFSTVADHVTSTIYMWQRKQVIMFLSLFENLGFRPVFLLDVFAEQVMQSPDSLTLKDILITFRVYSLLNHLPEGQHQRFLDSLNRVLETYLPRIPSVELLRAVYSCCILGYFPQILLNTLLQERILNELRTSANQNVELNERMLHYIFLCLELDNPSFTKPIDITLGKLSPASISSHLGVERALHGLLGDLNMLQQNVQLPNNYCIEFQINMDRNRRKVFPVDATEAPATAVDGQRVAVLCCPASSFCFGTVHPRGKLAMKMRHLEVLGYHVILVHEQEFEKLEEEDRIEFLRSKVFSENTASD
ncbi:FAST kinase domain-containing protein 2, mitochondrial isoform X2 [Rhinatrema bivittatum]|uniref:FAST kinase domain-containing protein 2, mitochondrial isoform X2 n=1 Tax=Rhinatrema bivittatum TaxID=194408 RepID=UPI0011268287|nr:FAST kinase domain-containing protein 2, mitochondrial isoform X2 [Rhinatrema bivittatum]